MAHSGVLSVTEPGEFAEAFHGANVNISVLTPGDFNAKITRAYLPSLLIMRVSESHPRILHSVVGSDRAIFSFQTERGPGIFRNGVELPPNGIARLARHQSYFQRSLGPVRWTNMSLPVEELHTAASCDLTPPQVEAIATPAPTAMAKLQRLNAAAGSLAESAPEVIDIPEAARGLEQALVEALVTCLGTADRFEDKAAQRRHHAIMRRFHAVLEAEPDRPLYVLEMAEAVGVSVRTLSACCHEHLGVGPKKYLLLRRMGLARQALYAAHPDATTVTDVATQYGFWQLGRFACEYRLLFGESPSLTLRRKRK